MKTFDWSMGNFKWEPWAWYEKVFLDDEIEEIRKISKDPNRSEITTGSIEEGRKDLSVRNCEVSFIYSHVEKNNFLHQRLKSIINELNTMLWNIDLTHLETLQYTKYDSKYKGHYDWHKDDIYENIRNSMRKLSFTLLLSDPKDFEGGNLELLYNTEENVMPLEKNKMILFPSYTLHRVTPVTKGIRESLVGWIHGPKWR
tara:strand:- start:15785 stop:16384 length:600 start_codon:yes stop_codon:yes gene_type:complete